MYKLSFIIPLYNSSKVIESTISNLCCDNSISDDIEIILVDDGSSDNTEDICKSIIDNYKSFSIQYYKKPNGGIASSRNFGLERCTGEFVFFHDHDDVFDMKNIHNILCMLLNNMYDLIMFNVKKRINGKDVPFVQNKAAIHNIDLHESLLKTMFLYPNSKSITNVFGNIWANIYRTSFIKNNNLSFKRIIHYEDDFNFLLETLLCKPRILVTELNVYYWVLSRESTSASFKKDDQYFAKVDSYKNYLCKTIPDFICYKSDLIKNRMWFYAYEYATLYLLANKEMTSSGFKEACVNLALREKLIEKNKCKKSFKNRVLVALFRLRAYKIIKMLKH